MNAMRLEPLKRMQASTLDADLDIAKADTCADIRKFGVINLEDNKARCVSSFMDSILAASDNFGNLNVLKDKASTRT